MDARIRHIKTQNARQLVEMSRYGGQEDVLIPHVMTELTELLRGGESQLILIYSLTCPRACGQVKKENTSK